MPKKKGGSGVQLNPDPPFFSFFYGGLRPPFFLGIPLRRGHTPHEHTPQEHNGWGEPPGRKSTGYKSTNRPPAMSTLHRPGGTATKYGPAECEPQTARVQQQEAGRPAHSTGAALREGPAECGLQRQTPRPRRTASEGRRSQARKLQGHSTKTPVECRRQRQDAQAARAEATGRPTSVPRRRPCTTRKAATAELPRPQEHSAKNRSGRKAQQQKAAGHKPSENNPQAAGTGYKSTTRQGTGRKER